MTLLSRVLARLAVPGVVALLVVVPPAQGCAADGRFVEGLEDVPLMPGLVVDENSGLTFDTPEGRIVEAVAVESRGGPRLDAGAVLRFYAESLPQLGWNASVPGEWRREGERLRLDIRHVQGALEVHFLLTPG